MSQISWQILGVLTCPATKLTSLLVVHLPKRQLYCVACRLIRCIGLLYCLPYLYLSTGSVLTNEDIEDRGFTDATLPCSVKKSFCPCGVALPGSCLQQCSITKCIFRYTNLLPDLNKQTCQMAPADISKFAFESLIHL